MARKTCTLFRLSLVEKEERQNSNCGVNFSQKSKRMGALFCRGRRSVPSIIFCVKFGGPTIFLGIPSSQKCHRKTFLFWKEQKYASYCYFVKKCEIPKILEFLVAVFQFLWVFQMTNARLIQTHLLKCFSREMWKRHLGDRL